MRFRFHLPLDERLSILRSADHFRKWWSLYDKRLCVLCERTFTGRQVRIRRDRRGRFLLHCPSENCNGGPNRWTYPLSSEAGSSDWWRALGAEEEEEENMAAIMNRKPHYA